MSTDKEKLITWATIGVLAYIISDIVHEAIGHGGTAILFGNQITLLSSVYFRSEPRNIIDSIGGPIANLCFSIVAFFVLKKAKNIWAILFLIHVLTYNLFWFAGTIISSAVFKTGDWTFAIRSLNAGQSDRYILFIAGATIYYLAFRFLNARLRQIVGENALTRQDFVFPFLFASISAFVAGLFFSPARLSAGLEGVLEMTASVPILFLSLNYVNEDVKPKPNSVYSLSVGILYIAFCLTLGRGMSF
ncbi:MAG: hypothetical protein WBO10_15685 [Pyrinomonadaceae bacterium]